jgi:hypothetical protein
MGYSQEKQKEFVDREAANFHTKNVRDKSKGIVHVPNHVLNTGGCGSHKAASFELHPIATSPHPIFLKQYMISAR